MPGPSGAPHLRALRFVARQWFLVGLAAVTALAWMFPAWGDPQSWLRPSSTLHHAVQLAFLITGLTLSTAAMRSALGRYRAHAAIQAFCFAVMPLMAWAVSWAVAPFHPQVAMGLRILGCLPTTIATAAIFTRAAGGNEALALCNTTLGNLLGVAVTPLLALTLADRSGGIEIGRSVEQLLLDVIIPFALGQLARPLWRRLLGEPWRWLKAIPSACVLLVGFIVFAGSFHAGTFDPGPAFLAATAGCAALYAAAVAAAWIYGGWPALQLDRGDRVAMLYCGAQKTLAVGVPLIAVLYKGDPDLALYTLPILIYHPMQLVIGAASAPALGRWIRS